MVVLCNVRLFCEVVGDFQGVFHMALDAQGKRLDALQEEEGIEGGDGRARVAQENRAQVDGEGGGADILGEGKPVVAGVRFYKPGEASRGRPVEFAAVDDDAAERRAVAADEFRR